MGKPRKAPVCSSSFENHDFTIGKMTGGDSVALRPSHEFMEPVLHGGQKFALEITVIQWKKN